MPENIWDNISRSFKDVFRHGDQIKRVEEQEFIPYNKLEIDLGTARTNSEFNFKGDRFFVIRNDGIATVRFNEKYNDDLDLTIINTVVVPFYRFFITNTTQSGKKLIVAVGREAAFEPKISPQMMVTVKDITPAVVSGNIAAGGEVNLQFNLDTSSAKQILIRSMGGYMSNSGSTSSYINFDYHDGTSNYIIKEKYESGTAATLLSWEGGSLIDRGHSVGGVLKSNFRVNIKNAGAAQEIYRAFWNVEKVS